MPFKSDPPPLGTIQFRREAKGVSQTLADLTHPEGPLYQLVAEVKRSNALSIESNRQLKLLQVGMILCLFSIGLVAWHAG